MYLYRYEGDCGYKGEQMLRKNVDSIVLKCNRCGRGHTARQVRNQGLIVSENDHNVNGVFVRGSNGTRL